MDRAFVQDTCFAVCASASDLQIKAKQWRDAEYNGHLLDAQHVAIALRETARRCYEIADEIERHCHPNAERVA